MVNPKSTPSATKEGIKEEIKAIVEGSYDKNTLEIEASGTHSKADLENIVEALKAGKAYVFDKAATRNTIYNIRKRLKDEYKLSNVKFGYLKKTHQSVIYSA